MADEDLSYQGNFSLKPENIKFEWTPEIALEWVKCKRDPLYFIETYMRIQDADGQEVRFKLYPYQRAMIEAMWKSRNSIFATARQAGKSTTTCAFILWFIIFNKGKNVAILANVGKTASEILAKVKYGYEGLPMWMKHGVKKFNENTLFLENRSRVLAGTTTKSAIRGYTISLLFIDEAAHVENWDEFYTSVFNTISSGKKSKIVLVSTPLGLNHFHAFWKNANRAETDKDWNGFKPVLVTWKDVPGRDAAWRIATLKAGNGDLEKFAQEHEVEFLGSSGTLISGRKLKELVSIDPINSLDGLLNQYFSPVRGKLYSLIADVSRGRGLDYSAFNVIDVTKMPYQQVASYRNNLITPIDYADVIHGMAKHYNDALVLVETNDIGEQICDLLYHDYEYINLVQTESAGAAGKRISQGFSGKHTDKGIRTTVRVKNIGCSILKMLVEQDQLIVNDEETINEFKTFSRKLKSYEAEPGKHDDLVMTLVLFSWMTDQTFFKEYTDINTLTNLREKTDDQLMQELAPFGIIEDGLDYEEVTMDGHAAELADPWALRWYDS